MEVKAIADGREYRSTDPEVVDLIVRIIKLGSQHDNYQDISISKSSTSNSSGESTEVDFDTYEVKYINYRDAKRALNNLEGLSISGYHISVDEGTDRKIIYINVPIESNIGQHKIKQLAEKHGLVIKFTKM